MGRGWDSLGGGERELSPALNPCWARVGQDQSLWQHTRDESPAWLDVPCPLVAVLSVSKWCHDLPLGSWGVS